jgi:hypothetical protein
MKFNLSEFNAYVNILKPETALLIRGTHGIGKSAVCKAFAEAKGLRFLDVRLGQKEIGDILGQMILSKDEAGRDISSYALPKDLSPAFHEPCLLFFDELNRGTKDVMQAVFQIILDRKFHSEILHPGTYVWAAINNNDELYTITPMDPALINRFSTLDFEPKPLEWLNLAEKERWLEPEIVEFLKQNQNFVDPPSISTGKKDLSEILNDPHPSRRSWTKFNCEVYLSLKEIGEFKKKDFRNIAATFVGMEAAEHFARDIDNLLLEQKKRSSNLSENDKTIQQHFRSLLNPSIQNYKVKLENEKPNILNGLTEKLIADVNDHSVTEKYASIVERICTNLPDEFKQKFVAGVDLKKREQLQTKNKTLVKLFS